MAHTITVSGSTFTIYVDEDSEKNEPIVAEHQILDATYTTLQYLGGKSPIRTIGFAYNGSNISTIKSDVNEGRLVLYVDDLSVSGSYVVKDFTARRVQALNYATPWYRCSMTMINVASSGSLYYQWTDPIAPPR